MKKNNIMLILATILIIIGFSIFMIAMSINKWDFSKLGSSKYETNIYEITEEFDDIIINSDTFDICFELSNDNTCKVIYVEEEKYKHDIDVQNNKLNIDLINNKKWYDNIRFGFINTKITIYLPNNKYNSLFIDLSTGDIEIPNQFQFYMIDINLSTGDVKCMANVTSNINITTSAGDVKLSDLSTNNINISTSTGTVKLKNVNCGENININDTTGDVKLENIKCDNITSSGSTSDVLLKNVIVINKIDIKRSTGDVRFELSDAKEIKVITTTGNIRGTLLTEKIFITDSNTGDIEVPKSLTGGLCEIKTNTGDIVISIK